MNKDPGSTTGVFSFSPSWKTQLLSKTAQLLPKLHSYQFVQAWGCHLTIFASNQPLMNMKKIVALLSGGFLITVFLISTSTQISSCSQKEIMYDTVYIKDTIVIPCECKDLKEGLVAYYNFKDGNLNDSSGKNNHIAFNNATKTADRFGNANGAYLFNGSSNYMSVPNSASLNPANGITMMAIVKVNGFYAGTCHANQIFGKVDPGGDYTNGFYNLRFSDYEADCSSPANFNREIFSGAYGDNAGGNGPSVGTDTVNVKTGQWYTLVYTYANGYSHIYVNGVLKNSRQHAGTFTPNVADLLIGRTPSSQYPYWFNGVIDEIRIYEKALCPSEVKLLSENKK